MIGIVAALIFVAGSAVAQPFPDYIASGGSVATVDVSGGDFCAMAQAELRPCLDVDSEDDAASRVVRLVGTPAKVTSGHAYGDLSICMAMGYSSGFTSNYPDFDSDAVVTSGRQCVLDVTGLSGEIPIDSSSVGNFVGLWVGRSYWRGHDDAWGDFTTDRGYRVVGNLRFVPDEIVCAENVGSCSGSYAADIYPGLFDIVTGGCSGTACIDTLSGSSVVGMVVDNVEGFTADGFEFIEADGHDRDDIALVTMGTSGAGRNSIRHVRATGAGVGVQAYGFAYMRIREALISGVGASGAGIGVRLGGQKFGGMVPFRYDSCPVGRNCESIPMVSRHVDVLNSSTEGIFDYGVIIHEASAVTIRQDTELSGDNDNEVIAGAGVTGGTCSTTAQGCLYDHHCPGAETCTNPVPTWAYCIEGTDCFTNAHGYCRGTCSVTTSTQCRIDGECPGGETCSTADSSTSGERCDADGDCSGSGVCSEAGPSGTSDGWEGFFSVRFEGGKSIGTLGIGPSADPDQLIEIDTSEIVLDGIEIHESADGTIIQCHADASALIDLAHAKLDTDGSMALDSDCSYLGEELIYNTRFSPTTDEDYRLVKIPQGRTIVGISCITDADTVEMDIEECSASGASCTPVDSTITCDSDGATDDGSISDTALAAGAYIGIDLGTVSGSAAELTVTIRTLEAL